MYEVAILFADPEHGNDRRKVSQQGILESWLSSLKHMLANIYCICNYWTFAFLQLKAS